MSVIAKISSYFERSVVTLKLRKEYLNTVTYNTPVLLRIKYWTVWYIERYSTSSYTEVSNFQKTVRFFGPPCIYRYLCRCLLLSTKRTCRVVSLSIRSLRCLLLTTCTRWTFDLLAPSSSRRRFPHEQPPPAGTILLLSIAPFIADRHFVRDLLKRIVLSTSVVISHSSIQLTNRTSHIAYIKRPPSLRRRRKFYDYNASVQIIGNEASVGLCKRPPASVPFIKGRW